MEIICKIYLNNYLSRFSSLLLRIENPYTQWVWIANPDQRHDTNIRWVGGAESNIRWVEIIVSD